MSDNPEYPSGEPVDHSVTLLHRVRVRHVQVLDGGERFIANPDEGADLLGFAQEAGLWTASAYKPWGLEITTSLGDDGDPAQLFAWLREAGERFAGEPERFGFAPDLAMVAFDATKMVDTIRKNLSGEVGHQGYDIAKMHLGAPIVEGPLEVYIPVQLELTYR